jgi:hypothetical protein
MKEQRDTLIDTGNQAVESTLGFQKNNRINRVGFDPSKLLGTVDNIQKLQGFYATIPVWPTSSGKLLLPNLSFLISILTLAYKAADAFKQTIQ